MDNQSKTTEEVPPPEVLSLEGRGPTLPNVLERQDDGPTMRVHFEYKNGDEKGSNFLAELQESCPGAKITSQTSEEDCFEFIVNEKVVYSKRLLHKDPDPEELMNIAQQLDKGKSFMHLYLCSFMEGGEPRMVVADRKATPLVKRVILACTVM